MQDNIYNNSGRRLSRLEGVQAALEELGAKIEAQLASHPDCLANFRAFIYAFGIRAGSGVADMISVVRASRTIDLNAAGASTGMDRRRSPNVGDCFAH